jgi:hypothetical protein
MARRIYTIYIIKLFINKDLKLKERKGKEKTSNNTRSYIHSLSHVRVI